MSHINIRELEPDRYFIAPTERSAGVGCVRILAFQSGATALWRGFDASYRCDDPRRDGCHAGVPSSHWLSVNC